MIQFEVEPVVLNGLVWERTRQSPMGTSSSTFQCCCALRRAQPIGALRLSSLYERIKFHGHLSTGTQAGSENRPHLKQRISPRVTMKRGVADFNSAGRLGHDGHRRSGTRRRAGGVGGHYRVSGAAAHLVQNQCRPGPRRIRHAVAPPLVTRRGRARRGGG
jgi:hypothetical protein